MNDVDYGDEVPWPFVHNNAGAVILQRGKERQATTDEDGNCGIRRSPDELFTGPPLGTLEMQVIDE